MIYPDPVKSISQWIVYGLDPSMSRTGYAILQVAVQKDPREGQPCDHPGCFSHVSHLCEGCGRMAGRYLNAAEWLEVGSVKPQVTSTPIWIRGKGMSLFLKSRLTELATVMKFENFIDTSHGQERRFPEGTGLLISMEYPTPMNDFLVALNRMIHLVFFEGDSLFSRFDRIQFLTTNAATLRSLMGLYTKGNNKKENIVKAYEFVPKWQFPRLDPDSCDAVLLAMMGRYAASILMGESRTVPYRFLISLCSGEQKKKGKGRNQRIMTAGILHRPEYFYSYTPQGYDFCHRNASLDKIGLDRFTYQI